MSQLFKGWYLRETEDGLRIFKDYGDRAYAVATIENWSEDTEAIGNMLVSAPEMFEALEMMAEAIHLNVRQNSETWRDAMAQLKVALAKAGGAK